MTKTISRKTRRDLHAEITNQIIAAIEADPGRPQMPWRKSGGPLWLPENAFTHAPYNGINIVNLWVAAERRSFSSHLWATYKQWQDLGAQVRKGAKSHPSLVDRHAGRGLDGNTHAPSVSLADRLAGNHLGHQTPARFSIRSSTLSIATFGARCSDGGRLDEEGADLVDGCGASRNQPRPDAMARLKIELIL